jgi:uncharacterized protein GlcG (DUF336 family)
MRQIAVILALLAGSVPAVAAESWKEYRDPAFAFAATFPGDPKVETTTYQLDGRPFVAHVYSVAQDNAVFKVTVAEISDPALNENAVIDQAIKALSAGGEIKVNIAHRISRVFGRQLSIVEGDGSRLSAAVFFHQGRLYQIEGQSRAGGDDATGEAIRFAQSLIFTGNASNRPAGERDRRGPPRGPGGPDGQRAQRGPGGPDGQRGPGGRFAAARGPEQTLALEAAQAAINACAMSGYKVGVSVVDSAGVLKVLLAADGANRGAIESSTRKAFTANAMKVATAELQEQVKSDATLAAKVEADPHLFARAGGVPLMVGSDVIGAIGVGGAPGGDKDQACTQAGVERIAPRLK